MNKANTASELMKLLEDLPDKEKDKFYASLVEDFPDEIEEAQEEAETESAETESAETEEPTENEAETDGADEADEMEDIPDGAEDGAEDEEADLSAEADEETPEETPEEGEQVEPVAEENESETAGAELEKRLSAIENLLAVIVDKFKSLGKQQTLEEAAKEVYGLGNGVFPANKEEAKSSKMSPTEIGNIVRKFVN